MLSVGFQKMDLHGEIFQLELLVSMSKLEKNKILRVNTSFHTFHLISDVLNIPFPKPMNVVWLHSWVADMWLAVCNWTDVLIKVASEWILAKIRRVKQCIQLSMLLTNLFLNFTHVLLNMMKCERFQTSPPEGGNLDCVICHNYITNSK